MNKQEVKLASFNNSWYKPGAGIVKRALWYMTNVLFFLNPCCTSSRIKRMMLRLYGARLGKRIVLKPSINIKYPWRLSIGENSWIGERVWIDNLGEVKIGANVCISQGAMLLCGNHDYTKASFDLIVGDIKLEDGSWIGAKSMVGPGVLIGRNAVLSASSVASSDLEADTIYRGNPAVEVKNRNISE